MDKQEKPIVPVREGMCLEKDDGFVLLGSRCSACGEEFFPRKEITFCSHCQSDSLEDVEFAPEGKIITYTTVLNRPAGNFYKGQMPFNYIAVQLDKADVIVQGHYIDVDENDIHIGDPVKAIPAVMWEEEEKIVTGYKFVPNKREA